MPVLSIVLCVSLSHSLLLTLLSLILFSSLIAQQSTTPNQGHFKGIERRRKWKEEDEEEEGEKENSPRGQRKKRDKQHTQHTHIHTYIEREREKEKELTSPQPKAPGHTDSIIGGRSLSCRMQLLERGLGRRWKLSTSLSLLIHNAPPVTST